MAIEPKKTPKQPTKTLANRTFGLIFAGIFLVFTLMPLLGGNSINRWAALISGLFAALALIVPVALTPLNRFNGTPNWRHTESLG